MFRTPEQRRVMRWIERHIPVAQLLQVEALTKNALRIRMRSGEILVAIYRQDGEVITMDDMVEAC